MDWISMGLNPTAVQSYYESLRHLRHLIIILLITDKYVSHFSCDGLRHLRHFILGILNCRNCRKVSMGSCDSKTVKIMQ